MIALPAAPRVVWQAQKGSQSLAVSCPCNEILYHGSRGPGKTDAQLMAFRKNVGRGYGAFWRGIIFDREYKNLDDIVTKSKRWFNQFGDGAQFKESAKDYKWVWPTGEELLFRVGYKENDYDAYHGHEYPFIGFNELTKQPTRKFYDAIKSCNRSSFLPMEHSPDPLHQLPEIPLVIFSTTNPHGAGHNWVKSEFIDKAQPGRVLKVTSDVFNPRTQLKQKVTRTRCHLFGSYRENRFLSPEYIAILDGQKDPNKRKAWLEGDWNIVAGGAFDDVWNESIHVVPRFKIPEQWNVDRSFDWGSSKPFSVGWWAEANGEEVTLPTGKKFCPKRGSLIRIAEWYGTKEVGLNEGLKLGSALVAKGILEREQVLIAGKWVAKVYSGPADNAIRSVTDNSSDSVEKIMGENGVYWTESDKRPGSRKVGFQLVRDRLDAALKGEGPALYFMDNCRATISTLPVLPRDSSDPDDIDTEAEDHAYDDVRYRVLAGNIRAAMSINVRNTY